MIAFIARNQATSLMPKDALGIVVFSSTCTAHIGRGYAGWGELR